MKRKDKKKNDSSPVISPFSGNIFPKCINRHSRIIDFNKYIAGVDPYDDNSEMTITIKEKSPLSINNKRIPNKDFKKKKNGNKKRR